MSVGHSFLIRESETERLEDVVLLIPQPVQMKQPEQPPQATSAKANGT
jgi:hypothetical protein